jgi:hypothetical protein
MFLRDWTAGGTGRLRPAKLASLFAALLFAGCQSEPIPPPAIAEMPRSAGLVWGVDLPTDASDVLGELKNIPLAFVARYYRDPASRWPTLTASEVQRLSARGVKLVTVWEWHSRDPAYFSYASGYNDALKVYRQAKTVRQPAGSAIYFAVDFNARAATLQLVDQYFSGVAAGFVAAGGGRPEYKIGVYGSGAVCAEVKAAGLAQYSWLTGSTAWDGTLGYTSWNIRQAAHGARFGALSFNHDANEARDDYGGFRLAGDDVTPQPVASDPPDVATPQPAEPKPDHSLAGLIKSWF